jgi:hypothetical protein
LNQANEAQNELNDAMLHMDISGANEAYNRLNAIIDDITRGIRDNEAAQNNFNGAIGEGSNAMNGLTRKIDTAVAA